MPTEYTRQFTGEKALTEDNVYVSLTYDSLDATTHMSRVKSPKAGAVVLFAGKLYGQLSGLDIVFGSCPICFTLP